MVRRLQKFIPALLLVVFASVLTFSTASAATNSLASNDGMKVSPVRTDLIMSAGQTRTVTVGIENVTSTNGTYNIITNDFQAKDESGAPNLLLNGALNAQHGLKQYMSAPKSIVVNAGEQKQVTVTITLPANIAGGGYYGAVRFAPATGTGGGANVSLSGSVASLILVSVPGDVTENLQIASFSASHGGSSGSFFTSNKNLSATVRFRNSGNVQEQPFGKILLKKGDKTLKSFEVNGTNPRGNVLPDSIRRFDVPLTGIGALGKYTLVGNFGYGSHGQLVSASTTFYVVPLALVIVFIVIVLLLIALLVGGPRAIKRYNQRVLHRAGRR